MVDKYEDFVWHNREVITVYLEKKCARKLQEAVDDADYAWRARSFVRKHDSPPEE